LFWKILFRRLSRTAVGIFCFVFLFNSITWGLPSPESSGIEVPSDLATVQEVKGVRPLANKGPDPFSEKLVIYIQDIHTSVRVQRDIARLIEFYVNRYGVKLVGYEGNTGPIETQKVFWFPDEKLKRVVSGEFLEKLRISGPEYAHINSKIPFELYGLEDAKSYEKNLRAFQNAQRIRQEAINLLREIESNLILCFNKIASTQAQKLFRIEEEYRKGRVNVIEFAKVLDPGFRGNDQLPKEFLAELRKLQQRAEEGAFNQPLEREVVSALENVRILISMAGLSAGRDELNRYWADASRFSERNFRDLIKKILGPQKSFYRNQDSLDQLMKVINEFYRVAEERDRILADQLVERSANEKISILVTGGFHTPGITKKLQKEKIPYILITPNFHGKEKKTEKLYLDSIMEKQTFRKPDDFNRKTEEARRDLDQYVLDKIRRGGSEADPRPFVNDLQMMESGQGALNEAKSLGGVEKQDPFAHPEISILVPPDEREDDSIDDEFSGISVMRPEFFRIDYRIQDPEQQLIYGSQEQIGEDERQRLTHQYKVPERKKKIDKVKDNLDQRYPGLFENTVIMFIDDPAQPVVLSEQNGMKLIVMPFHLIFYRHIFLAGLMEVLIGRYLKHLPHQYAVKLYAMTEALEWGFIYEKADDNEVQWLNGRLKALERHSFRALLKKIWDSSRKDDGSYSFTLDLKDSSQKEVFLGTAIEVWTDGSREREEFEKIKAVDGKVLEDILLFLEDHMEIKGLAERLEICRTQGTAEQFLRILSPGQKSNLLVYLAKNKQYQSAEVVLGLKSKSKTELQRVSKLLLPFVNGLYVGATLPVESGMRLTEEELSDILIHLHQLQLYLVFGKGSPTAIDSFVQSLPTMNLPKPLFDVPMELKKRVSGLFTEKFKEIKQKKRGKGLSLGVDWTERLRTGLLVPPSRTLIPGASEEQKVVLFDPQGSQGKLDFGPGANREARRHLLHEGYGDRNEGVWEAIRSFSERFPSMLEGITVVSMENPEYSAKLEDKVDGKILKVDHRPISTEIFLASFAEALYGYYLEHLPNKMAVKLYAMIQALNFLVKTEDGTPRELLERRLEAHGRDDLIRFLNAWGNRTIEIDSLTPSLAASLLEILRESWPKREVVEEFTQLKGMPVQDLIDLLLSVDRELAKKAQSERLAKAQGVIARIKDEGLEVIDSKRLGDSLKLLAKNRDFDSLFTVINTKWPAEKDPTYLGYLYDSLMDPKEAGVPMTPRELAGAFAFLHGRGLFYIYEGAQYSIADYVLAVPVISGVPEEKVREVARHFRSMAGTQGKSLGADQQEILFQVERGDFDDALLRRIVLRRKDNQKITFLIGEREDKEFIQRKLRALKLWDQSVGKVKYETNGLNSPADRNNLKDYIDGLKTLNRRIVLIANQERLLQLQLKGLVFLAKDRVGTVDGSSSLDVSTIKEFKKSDVNSALFDLASKILDQGSGTTFQNQIERDGIMLMRLDYLQEALARRVLESLGHRHFSMAA